MTLSSVKNRIATGVDRYAREVTAALRAQGVDAREVVLERFEMKLGNLRVGGLASLWLQRMRVHRGGVDVLHALDPSAAALGCDIVTVHDILAEQFPQWFLADARVRADWSFARALTRRSRYIITSSEATKREVVSRWGYDADRIVAAHLGIDHALFRPTPAGSPLLAEDRPTLVCVGDDNPRKNVLLAVEAVADLAERHGVRARLVRAGPSRFPAIHGAYRRVAKQRGVDLVEPGYVADADLVKLLSGAAGYVWPTQGEGFGLPPLEAMACGTPVVALDTPINHEVCGRLARYHANDSAACAGAIAEMLRFPPAEEALVAHARQFTWEACARKIIEVYQRVVKEAAA